MKWSSLVWSGGTWQREEASQSTEKDRLKEEDDDIDTDVIFDQPEEESESQRHLLSASPASKMQNGSATKQQTREAPSQVALPSSAKQEPKIYEDEQEMEVTSIPAAKAANKEPEFLGGMSSVSNLETKALTGDTSVHMVAPGKAPVLHASSALVVNVY